MTTAAPDRPVGTFSLDDAFRLAVERHTGGDPETARYIYGEILKVRPTHAPALHNLGVLDHGQGRLNEAEAWFRRSIEAQPGYTNAHRSLALVLHGQRRLAEAEAAIRRALILEPASSAILGHLGRLVFEGGRLREAVPLFRRAARLDPHNSEPHTNLGAALRLLAQLDPAITALRHALALTPDNPEALNNLGSTLKLRGDIEGALILLRRAQRVAPDFAGAHWNESLTLLLAGRLREGWAKYGWRWRIPDFPSPQRTFPQPKWAGEPLNDKTLLIYWEQGFGDSLHFIRYAALARQRLGAARVIVECQRPLARLFRSLDHVDEVVPVGAPLPPFDYHLPLLDLPGLFDTTLETIPVNIPYVRAEPAQVAHWRDRLAGSGLKVGLVWAGNTTFGEDRLRSPRLGSFLPLFDIPGIQFFGLQMGDGRKDLERYPLPGNFRDLGSEIADFTDTAAIMTNLDLIISSCTSPVHLAGGLGRPTWVVIPYAPDFRWMLGREDSPWYPGLRLFRQDAPGAEWEPVMARVTRALNDWR